jgi:hypothetical protein
MSFCPKCGNKVDENMVFCPHCGTSLKAAPPSPPAPVQPYRRKDEKSEKNEKQEKQEKGERQEKGETGFIGYLIGGLILITFGLFSVLQLSVFFTVDSGQSWAIMLLIIGIIIIFGAIYVAMGARKRSPKPP